MEEPPSLSPSWGGYGGSGPEGKASWLQLTQVVRVQGPCVTPGSERGWVGSFPLSAAGSPAPSLAWPRGAEGQNCRPVGCHPHTPGSLLGDQTLQRPCSCPSQAPELVLTPATLGTSSGPSLSGPESLGACECKLPGAPEVRTELEAEQGPGLQSRSAETGWSCFGPQAPPPGLLVPERTKAPRGPEPTSPEPLCTDVMRGPGPLQTGLPALPLTLLSAPPVHSHCPLMSSGLWMAASAAPRKVASSPLPTHGGQ